jgi:hypothetical protein
LPAGRHLVEVRGDLPGPLRSWRGEVVLEAQKPQTVTAILATTPVADVRVAAPGPGMVYIDGVAWGREKEALLQAAGTYAIGAWDGTVWSAATATIAGEGQLTNSAITTGDRPDGPAWWCSRDEDGRPVDRHHVVCWWEAELVRTANRLPEYREWMELGSRPEKAAIRIPRDLLPALRLRIQAQGMRLPAPDHARRLGDLFPRAGIWCAEGERLDVIGGSPATALLVAVPPGP